MDVVFIGILLGIFLLILIISSYRKYKNYFHPMVIFPALEFLSYVPGLILLKHESSVVFTFEKSLILFTFEFIYVSGAMITMYFRTKGDQRSRIVIKDIPLYRILGCYAIGLYAKFMVFKELGGLIFVMDNAQLSYELQSHGFGVYITMYKFMLVAIIAMFDKYVIRRKSSFLLLLIGMVVIYMLSYLIYTSRTPAFIILLIILFIINFEWSRFRLKSFAKIKFIIPASFIIIASNYATNQRTSTSNLVGEESPLIDMVRNMSKDGRDMFVYEYFNWGNFWYGEGYANIPYALNPFTREKPSLDDGIFLVNLLRGNDININANSGDLPEQTGSVPFSTPAYMYANFGIIGVLIGGVLMGLVYIFTFNKMRARTNAFSITIYFYVIYSFGLSTGRMVPTLITIIFILISEKILGGKIRIRKLLKSFNLSVNETQRRY